MTKQQITELVFKNLPVTPAYTVSEVFPLWWKDTSRRRGFRLTESGEAAFVLADIEGWTFELDLTPQLNYFEHLLALNTAITCPYYIYLEDRTRKSMIRNIRIKVYDSRVAMMIGLYGSVALYIEQQNRKGKKHEHR